MSSRKKFTKPESRWSLWLKDSSMISKRKSTSQSLLTMTQWRKATEKWKNKLQKWRLIWNANHHALGMKRYSRQSSVSMLKTSKLYWEKNWTRLRTELRNSASNEWPWSAMWMQLRQWLTSWATTFTCRSRTGRMRSSTCRSLWRQGFRMERVRGIAFMDRWKPDIWLLWGVDRIVYLLILSSFIALFFEWFYDLVNQSYRIDFAKGFVYKQA